MMAARLYFSLAAGLVLALAAVPAAAQVAVSVTAESDYRFRGLSLSDRQPDLRVNLSYDARAGAYAGLSLVAAADHEGWEGTKGYIAYAGYISPRHAGVAWEAGLTHTHVHERETYDYSEVYTGLVGDTFSARLSWSPRYYGRDMATLYTDLGAGHRLSPHVRVFAHLGALTPLSGPWRDERYDLRAGMAVSVRNYEVQLAATRTNPLVGYNGREIDGGDAVVVSASAFF